jgi:hypothetical protein
VLKQKTGVQQERFPNTLLLQHYGAAFAAKDGTEPDEEALNTFRQLGRDTLGADDTVFADADQSSFALADERVVTADPRSIAFAFGSLGGAARLGRDRSRV